jgi:basic membrane protein A
VLVSFIGSFDDVSAAKKAAQSQVAQGADLLIGNADSASLGVFQTAAKSHIYAFGSSRAQNAMMPAVVLASAVADIPDAFMQIASEVKAGTFKPGMIAMGMKAGMVKLVYTEKLKNRISKAALDRAKAAEQEIIAGKLDVSTMAAAK